MNEKTNFTFEEKVRTAIKDINPDSNFKDNLWLTIVQKQEESHRNKPVFGRLKPVLISMMIVIIVGLAVTVIGPENIAQAFSKLQGYLPGIGFVQSDGDVLYLENPISVEESGITLTINQVRADEKNVVLNYEFSDLSDQPACHYINNLLLLPNGREYLPTSGGSVAGTNREQKQLYFQPLPQGVRTFTLVVANEKNISFGCEGPEEWQIEVTLKPRPEGETLTQVIQREDLQIITPDIIKTREKPSNNKISFDPSTIIFSIDKVAILEDSYVVSGHFDYTNPDPKNMWIMMKIDYSDIKVLDANEKIITIQETANDTSDDNSFVFKFDKDNIKNPISIDIQSAIVTVNFLRGDTFTFDAGQHPEVGQSWQVNQKMDLMGYEVNIESVTATPGNSSSQDMNEVSGYAINIADVDSDILSIMFSDKSDRVQINEIIDVTELEDGNLVLEYSYSNSLPVNTVTYQISQLTFKINQNWVFEMELP